MDLQRPRKERPCTMRAALERVLVEIFVYLSKKRIFVRHVEVAHILICEFKLLQVSFLTRTTTQLVAAELLLDSRG